MQKNCDIVVYEILRLKEDLPEKLKRKPLQCKTLRFVVNEILRLKEDLPEKLKRKTFTMCRIKKGRGKGNEKMRKGGECVSVHLASDLSGFDSNGEETIHLHD
jgi:hypothetical protein